MARGATLSQLITNLRGEVRLVADAAAAVSSDHVAKQLLRRTQETLYDKYDWPHLDTLKSFTTTAGDRYYDLPADLDYEQIRSVVAWWNTKPLSLTRGIGWSQYSIYSSDDGHRSEPTQRWDIREDGGVVQIELWPIPVSTGTKIQIEGIRRLGSLIANDDTADLDDHLIVLFAAAEVLAGQGAKDADIKLAAARDRLATVRGRTKGGSSPFILGGGVPRKRPYDHPIIVVTQSS